MKLILIIVVALGGLVLQPASNNLQKAEGSSVIQPQSSVVLQPAAGSSLIQPASSSIDLQ